MRRRLQIAKRHIAIPAMCFLIVMLIGPACMSVGPYRAAISSDDVNERIMGIVAAGQARDHGAVPLLVDRLEDEDDAVRFYAILALERITGERFGYDYAKQSVDRAASVAQWRSYIRRGAHLTLAQEEMANGANLRHSNRPSTELP